MEKIEYDVLKKLAERYFSAIKKIKKKKLQVHLFITLECLAEL